MNTVDTLEHGRQVREVIRQKPSLRRLYEESYSRFQQCVARCPAAGTVLEIGSGAGFAREIVRDTITSDVLPYDGVDVVLDAVRLPFSDDSVRCIFMLNVLHHLPDVSSFLHEARRVLLPGGRILIVDQYPGVIGHWVYKYMHHEPYDPAALQWSFESTGPLSGANGALAWIVFFRDRAELHRLLPELNVKVLRPHTPLRYWLTGGLRSWSLLPAWAFDAATALDKLLIRLSPRLGCFLDIELVKTVA